MQTIQRKKDAKLNDALEPLVKEARRHKSAKDFYHAFVRYQQRDYAHFAKLLRKQESRESAEREADMFNPAKSQKDYVPESLVEFYNRARGHVLQKQ